MYQAKSDRTYTTAPPLEPVPFAPRYLGVLIGSHASANEAAEAVDGGNRHAAWWWLALLAAEAKVVSGGAFCFPARGRREYLRG